MLSRLWSERSERNWRSPPLPNCVLGARSKSGLYQQAESVAAGACLQYALSFYLTIYPQLRSHSELAMG